MLSTSNILQWGHTGTAIVKPSNAGVWNITLSMTYTTLYEVIGTVGENTTDLCTAKVIDNSTIKLTLVNMASSTTHTTFVRFFTVGY